MRTLSTREATIEALMEVAEHDKRLIIVSPDSMLAARAKCFRDTYPDRFIEVGIAEQNAVDIAAGLASTGLLPIVITYAGFLTMRACEMIRTFIAYPGLNVKLVGLNGGLLGGEREGVTHQFFEDLGILRSIPGIALLTPADAHQAYHATRAMLEINGPVYLRLASGREPEVFTRETPFVFGKLRTVCCNGNDVAIFSSGYVMDRCIAACEHLKSIGIDATLYDVSTLKPIDADGITNALQQADCAITVEDHNIYGALGSAICEVSCERHPCRVLRLGLKDVYPRSGHAAQLLDAYGLSVSDIVAAAIQAVKKH